MKSEPALVTMDPRPSLNSLALTRLTISQWKEICRELGLHFSGRKDELMTRVVTYLSSNRGRELNRTRTLSPDLSKVLSLLGIASVHPSGKDQSHLCLCASVPSPPGVECRRCLRMLHPQCVGRSASLTPFECPLCQLRQLEPFEPIVDTLLSPLHPCTSGSLKTVSFHCSEDQHRQALSPNHCFQLRCIRLDTEGYAYHWPKDCVIVVNNKTLCSLTQPPPTSSRKRKDHAIAIPEVKVGANDIIVIKQKEDYEYAFGVFIVERLPAETVIKALKQEAVWDLAQGKGFVRSILSVSGEVYSEACKQSVKCPLTRVLPVEPVRGVKCRHIQCFDFEAYVVMQEKAKVNRWKCPICGSLAIHLIRDKYMQEIVEMASLIGSSLVEFNPDGSYYMIPEIEDEESESEGETVVPVIRKGTGAEPGLVKKQAAGQNSRLAWRHFRGIGYADNVGCEIIRASQPYLCALERYAPPPVLAKTGQSAICAIDVD